MIIEQKFSEPDLIEIEQVFSKTMEAKSPVLTKALKIFDFLRLVCMCILFGCSIAVTVLRGRILIDAILWAVIGATGVPIIIAQNKLREKMKPKNVVMRKYGQPFVVVIDKDRLVYKQIDYLYTDIKFIVKYKTLLFIRVNRKAFVMKLNEKEEEELFSKIAEIRVIHKEEPFDLREIR